MKKHLILLAFLPTVSATAETAIRYDTQRVCDLFYAEGAAFADINKDGKSDIVYGPHWYAGPDFKAKQEIYQPEAYITDNQYSKNFVAYAPDLNNDGWPDYLVLGFPGDWAYWFENPKGAEGHWKRHNVVKIVDNESPAFGDLTGDGKPEVICSVDGFFGYASPDWADPAKEWTFQKVSTQEAGGKFTHGLGYGDINGDGKADLLEKNAWWEQPADLRTQEVWTKHPYPFSGQGGAQMFAYDFDGDGDNDVLSSEWAHGFGLLWHEQVKEGGAITFKPHRILGDKPEDNAQGVYFSQLHAVDMADINGDGVKDIITGKRHFAHGSKGDPASMDPAVLYWFEVKPGKKSGEAQFIAHFIDDDSGVGTQVMAGDVSGDGLQDIIVGSKKGCHVSIAKKVEVDAEGFESIFDGKSLAGWSGEPTVWRVEDGAIVGESKEGSLLTKNTFLLWNGKLADFELRLKFRITGPAEANSGIQFRCQDMGNFVVKGYQADIDRARNYLGTLHDEAGRGALAGRGTETVWKADGTKEEKPAGDSAALAAAVNLDGWVEYAITAQANKITLKLNGTTTATCVDGHTAERELYGKLALQMHAGPAMKVEFKDIRLKRDP